ncbi:substrate-binding domain-containing protein [Flavobacterium sp. H122]|uniref:substrate-binding domain-containing protein n=1 Tax=Flavobacterium sp. H122 TaxID=2529860 RepID=UPI0010AA7988|nr:substrate-binding domain-containing protein [Flavobacterium sp. H122]
MKSVKIAGVPEHFNLPWHLCIENGEFDQVGIDLQWTDVPEGTGKMCQMLRNEETDIAVILTEGIIKDITAGNNSSIVQVYVQSPLIWGIHVDTNSKYNQLSDLENTTSAISRIGSGSHLMSFVNAKQQNWDTFNLKFEIVNTIDGAVEALQNGKADYFMWERFMTKPLVDNGTFRRIADCPTPWPCFVIAIRNEFLKNNTSTVDLILDIINNTTIEFKDIPSIDRTLASRYNQKLEDIQEWLKLTRWSQKKLDKNTFDKVQNQLLELNLIENKVNFETVVK